MVDHLTETHFLNDDKSSRSWKLDPISKDEDFDWIVKPTVDSVFDVGPTGMICTFGEMLENLKTSTLEGMTESTVPTSYSQEELFKYEDCLDRDGGILP